MKKNKLKPRFKAGQTVWVKFNCSDLSFYRKQRWVHFLERTYYKECKTRVVGGKVFVGLYGAGNDPVGPFDIITGSYLGEMIWLGISSVKLLAEKPKGYEPKQ